MKFPDLDQLISFRGRFMVYPYVSQTFYNPSGTQFTLAYRQFIYDGGITLTPSRKFPLFFEGGYRGESDNGRSAAPSNRSYGSIYAGIGLKFHVKGSDDDEP